MNADDLLNAINDLCEAYGKAKTCRTLAAHSAEAADHENLIARATHWDQLVNVHFQTVATAVHHWLPRRAYAETFLPVRPLDCGAVELHARDDERRRIVVQLNAAEAFALGAHLTAFAAIALDRTGAKIAPILPTPEVRNHA
jgi:hypothetical protein